MQFLLASATDVALHVLFDPGAVKHLTSDDIESRGETVFSEESAKGNLLCYYSGCDGRTLIRIYLDEPVPEDLLGKADSTAKDILLNIPGGTLVAGGAEFICNQDEVDAAEAYAPGRNPVVTKVSLPPGRYLADAYEIDWNRDGETVPKTREKQPGGQTLESIFGPVLGCGFFGTMAGAFIFLFGTIVDGWAPHRLWWIGAPLCLIVAGALGLILIPTSYWKEKEIRDSNHPSVVIAMRRIMEGEDGSRYKGGGFGLGKPGR